ncbi:hypothetical protein C7974DRAFT_347750 [Boeremia exigua]|uniref:uncharacterized protein n=1 Tax=Boeremia exigua TaxID=749465 RepID=UPI001E8D7309|nr:uncharacterized protein C7974DRAFT_347750 [Boeremia exigua]KAH6643594.1 hypothetical protein C7974DRAFT_347750 [Boeremia exigua]
MRGLNLPHAVLLAACAGSTAAAVGSGHRVLHAATRRSDVSKRDMKIAQKFEAEVVYVGEENGWDGRETFASSVKVGSRKPILCLEEIEHLLEDVQCGNGGMMLHFVDESAARDARAAAHGGHGGMGGLIITSHHSCNRDGERAVYKVDDVSFAKKGVALDLAVTEALWQDAFDNIDINFGHTRYDHIYRRHSDFMRARKKRQDDGLAIPMDTPDNIIDVTLDLTSELLNRTFTAEDFVTGLESFINLPVVPTLPLEIGCKNCSTRGEIVITQGAIKIDTKQIDFVPDFFDGGDDGKDVNSIITGGEFDLAVSGFGAHLEMFARPVKSGSYEIALFPLPVLGFVIPGIGQAGASFEPRISVDFDIDGELAINYGIDVAIPDGAGIKIALGDLANTTITGIKGATLKALPFTSDVTDAEIAISVAFTPTIPIGFEFSDKLSTLVSVALELPRLDAKLTPNAKAQCALLDQGNKTKPAEMSKPKDANLSGLVLVEANISVVVDVAADLTLPLLPAPFDSAGTTVNIFSTEMPLMTSCVRPVKGTVKFTQKSPAATITADKANYAPPPTSSCTTHVEDKPCDCGTATTTVYAAPPTDAPVTSANYGAPPPEQSSPPLELTPYYPEVPTPPADPETPVVETPIGGQGPTPHYPESPTDPVLTPTGGAYGPGEQPPTSTPCTSSETIRITVSTPPASSTPPPFTGAAVAAYGAPEMGWGGAWRVGVVVGGLVMGAVVV